MSDSDSFVRIKAVFNLPDPEWSIDEYRVWLNGLSQEDQGREHIRVMGDLIRAKKARIDLERQRLADLAVRTQVIQRAIVQERLRIALGRKLLEKIVAERDRFKRDAEKYQAGCLELTEKRIEGVMIQNRLLDDIRDSRMLAEAQRRELADEERRRHNFIKNLKVKAIMGDSHERHEAKRLYKKLRDGSVTLVGGGVAFAEPDGDQHRQGAANRLGASSPRLSW